jgi:hypothetical protein
VNDEWELEVNRLRVCIRHSCFVIRPTVGREGIEPLVVHLACFVTTVLQAATRNTTQVEVARVRVELTNSRKFELRRFAGLRTVLWKRPRWDLNPRSPA